MSEKVISNEILAHDFKIANHGKMEPDKLDAAAVVLEGACNQACYHTAGAAVASMIFYLKFSVPIVDGKTFNGNAGGISSPGGGALLGDVYTDDIARLYRDTVSFEFNCTPVYTSLLFFDKNSKLLGNFQSGSVSTVLGVGGGSGKWE